MDVYCQYEVERQITILQDLWRQGRRPYAQYLIEQKFQHFQQERSRGGFYRTQCGWYKRTDSYDPSTIERAQEIFEKSQE